MKYLSIAVLVILAIAGLVFFGMSEEPQQVAVENDFGSKVVYTTDASLDEEPFRADCRERGGEFNSCGSICEPGSDICADVCAYTCENLGEGEDMTEMQEYSNEDFDFSLEYPADDWSLEEDTSFEFSPKFNFYKKPAGVPLDLPLDHFANVTHVSVYPEGIPTEGVIGQTALSDLETQFDVNEQETRVFVLEDGTPFAAFIRPENPPTSWSEAGFVWVRARIENLESRCVRDGEEVSQEECDPLVNDDQIIRTGEVDQAGWERGQAILSTLNFAEGSGMDNLIDVETPAEGATIESPLLVTGEARGQWYFEANFPIVIVDWDGRIIAEHFATAQGDWMTEEFVPFEAEVEFDSPYSVDDPEFMQSGAVILQRANPSGLPENDAAVEIPVTFSPQE